MESDFSENSHDNLQLNFLFQQINPHFLYNTLESIRGKAVIEGAPEVADMIGALSHFFRYSIDRKNNIVTLKDELRNVEEYFKLQQFRFDNKFSISIIFDAGKEINEYLIPKMVIQPLVENAIVHGLEGRIAKGNITIRIVESDCDIIIYIIDDGVGILMERLVSINKDLKISANMITQNHNEHTAGIALININARLKMVFGKEYGIVLYSTYGLGTTVKMRIPKIKDSMTLGLH